MRKYKYAASYPNGKIVKGSMEAETSEQLKKCISNDGLILLEYRELHSEERCLKAIQLSEFCRELSSMISSGVPITRSLEIIIRREQSRVVKEAFESVYRLVKQGNALSSAMEKQNGTFPVVLIKMVVAGEISGKLDKTLMRMADYYEKEHRAGSEIRYAMLYPTALAAITLLVIIAIFAFVFPAFSGLLEGMELPAITRFMIGVSNLFTQHFYLVLIGLIVLIVMIKWLGTLSSVRFFLDRVKLKLPVTGRLFKVIYTARFSRTFSSLYAGGLPVISAIEIAASAIGNSYVFSQFDGVIRCVKSGESLSKSLSLVQGFDSKLTASLAVGEEAGKVDELLLSMSDSFDYEASAAIKKMIKLIEPVMICIMAAMILTVVLSVMIPIYDMYSNIGANAII